MDAAVTVLFIGVLIFIGNILCRVFTLTKIPDVLFLISIGIVIGPVFNIVEPDAFGVVGPLFTYVTLAIIMFEGGLHITIGTIRKAFNGTMAITLANFAVITLLCILILPSLAGFTFLESCMLGAIIGGTSSAVVIPFTNFLNIRNDTKAILALESAISDVLCIVVLLALLDIVKLNEFNPGHLIGTVIASFLIATIIGVIAGVWWSSVYHKLAAIKSVFITPAFVFIIFGVVNLMGFSGAIASLAFGVTLGNLYYFKAEKILPFFKNTEQIELTLVETEFLSQLVSVLKTFFFIYIGISIHFTNMSVIYLGAFITVAIYIARIVIVWCTIPRHIPKPDAAIMAAMEPKGLAAAVLASLPLAAGVAAGQVIQDTTYIVIFFSILVCSILVFLLEKTPFTKVYQKLFFSFGKEEKPEDTGLKT